MNKIQSCQWKYPENILVNLLRSKEERPGQAELPFEVPQTVNWRILVWWHTGPGTIITARIKREEKE
jgi:hypothetical protein